jgi:hypothetical protein
MALAVPNSVTRLHDPGRISAMRATMIALLLATTLVLVWECTLHVRKVYAEEVEPVKGATVGWSSQAGSDHTPAHGDIVRLRVRGEALAALIKAGNSWRLLDDGKDLPAMLVLPAAGELPTETALTIFEQSDASQDDLVAVLDRGEWADPIDKLRISIVAAEVRAVASIAVSTDNKEFQPAGKPQVVAQQFTPVGVLRLMVLDCAVEDERYIRLTLAGMGGSSLEEVQAWRRQERTFNMNELPATLGAMQTLGEGEHLWPLMLGEAGLPLAKVKVLADAPGEMRLMRIVRLGEHGHVMSTVTTVTWADAIAIESISRTEKWIELPGLDANSSWGIVVEEPGQDALQLTGAQAYVAEGALYFAMPDEGQVELWLEQPTLPRLELAEDELKIAQVTGMLSALDLEQVPPVVGDRAGDAPFYDWLTPVMARWGGIAGYSLGGLLCIIIGLVFVRGRNRER